VHDHDRLDEILRDLETALGVGDRETAASVLSSSRALLHRYIRREEDVLFPSVERRSSRARACTLRLRREHERMRFLVIAVERALSRGEARRGLVLVSMLRSVLLIHSAKEQWGIYPLLVNDAAGAPHGRADRIQAAPPVGERDDDRQPGH
jgi:hemerythrin-like domain-containing protein